MDINNIPKIRINNVEQQNVSQTPKANGTTFQGENGLRLLPEKDDSRYALLPTLKTDFGVKTGKLSFSPEQEDALREANISPKNYSIRSKVYILKNILNINDAIACVVNGFGLEEIDEMKQLTEKNLGLDSEDKIGLIAYGIKDDESIKRYIEIRDSYYPISETINQSTQSRAQLEKYEALLATKLGLSNDEINRYITIDENTNLSKDSLPPDEWMTCIKAGLEDKDFARFVQLKNKKIIFKKVTVRKQSSEQSQSVKNIIRYIEKEKKIMENLNLTQTQYEQIKDFLEKNFHEILAIRHEKSYEPKNEDFETNLKIIEEYLVCEKTKALNAAAPIIQSFLEKLPEEFWYQTLMGCDKDTHTTIKSAIQTILSTPHDDFEPVKKTDLPASDAWDYNYCYDNKTGKFSLNSSIDKNGKNIDKFEVILKKGFVNGKPVLIIEDQGSQNKYIAYNGAIIQVKQPRTNASEQSFESFGNLVPQEQAKVLAEAANAFPFDLFDENGKCIIGQKAVDIKNKTDDELKRIYGEKFLALKNNDKLTVQNILKLMPKDCMLAINPYIQDKTLLYSIVAEWFSKDGTKWQLEIHSQNIEYNKDTKEWIFRLYHEVGLNNQTGGSNTNNANNTNSTNNVAGANRKYFQFINEKSDYDFNGVYTGTGCEHSHIPIPSPFEEGNLLNNVFFQETMKLISTRLYKDFSISRIANELGFAKCDPTEATMRNIIDHCLHNPSDFAKYKDDVLKMRAALGCCDLS